MTHERDLTLLEYLRRLEEFASSEEHRLLIRQQIEYHLATENAHRALGSGGMAVTPPKAAEFCLAILLSEAKANAVIGDLNERLQGDNERYGVRRARYLYWARTIRSLWPLFRSAAMRAMKLGAFVETVRRFF